MSDLTNEQLDETERRLSRGEVRRSIPARPDDDDLVFAALRDELARLRADPRPDRREAILRAVKDAADRLEEEARVFEGRLLRAQAGGYSGDNHVAAAESLRAPAAALRAALADLPERAASPKPCACGAFVIAPGMRMLNAGRHKSALHTESACRVQPDKMLGTAAFNVIVDDPLAAAPPGTEGGRLDGTFYKRCPLCHKLTAPAPPQKGGEPREPMPCGCVECVCKDDSDRCHGCGGRESAACQASRLAGGPRHVAQGTEPAPASNSIRPDAVTYPAAPADETESGAACESCGGDGMQSHPGCSGCLACDGPCNACSGTGRKEGSHG